MAPTDGTLPLRQPIGAAMEMLLARGLFALPAPMKVRLSGHPPVRIDGLTLDPEIQLLLRLRARLGAGPLSAGTPEAARANLRREVLRYAGRPEPVGRVGELLVAGAAGPLRARHYAPADPGGPHPLLVFFHGGGFVLGDLDTHDALCRALCRHAGLHVVAVEYRLAPEHPFPAAVEDACAALAWAQGHATGLGADCNRVGVGGDSAGANLSTVTAQLAVREGRPAPAFQFLLYPVTDRTVDRPSVDLFGDGFVLTKTDMQWFDRHYLGETRAQAADPRAAPLRAPDRKSVV